MDLTDIPTITITQAMIDEYARLSGDYNPLHVDPAMAAGTPFGGTIAHGCIPMEPIFRAMHRLTDSPALPEGSSMSLRYLRPSQPGYTIRIEAGPVYPHTAGFAFACVNQRGEKVIEGRWSVPE